MNVNVIGIYIDLQYNCSIQRGYLKWQQTTCFNLCTVRFFFILSVFTSLTQTYSRPEWSRQVRATDGWVEAQVSFISESQLKVIFKATLDNNGVALDDISVASGSCRGGAYCTTLSITRH